MVPLTRPQTVTSCAMTLPSISAPSPIRRSEAGSDPMSKSSTAARRLPNREAALEALYSDISAKSMFPFWATSTDVAHDEIKQLMGTQKAVPHRWSYKNHIEPILLRATA